MTQKKDYNQSEARSRVVAFEVNAHLPAAYQELIFAEDRRFVADALKAKGKAARKILIVGGAGYVGSVLTDHLLNTGYGVRCFDNLLYNHGQAIVSFLHHPNFEYTNGNLTDESELEASLDGVTDVVLLAGLVGDPVTAKYPAVAHEVNDLGYDLLLRSMSGHDLNKVIFVSTCSNYGLIKDDQLAGEDFDLNPLSLYAESKVRFERQLLGMEGLVDYCPTILRFATAFGLSPRMRFDLTVSEFTRAMVLGENLLVYDANTWRPYCHLRDFGELIRRVLEAPRDRVAFEVFNAGGSRNNFTKQMIVDAILKQVPDGKVRFQEHGSDPRNYRVDFTKVRNTLHFEPAFGIPDGIRELVAALDQGLFRDLGNSQAFHGNWEIPDIT